MVPLFGHPKLLFAPIAGADRLFEIIEVVQTLAALRRSGFLTCKVPTKGPSSQVALVGLAFEHDPLPGLQDGADVLVFCLPA